ncbi:hypothetical protein [Pedobacter aquatilis]|uniref:hypothetical protein n=1 Tax=Pedobacter aquatilis TaxID=351343 RepID=UPI0029301E1F|nr:hypothetical protein [Pedobacter aquatilis]
MKKLILLFIVRTAFACKKDMDKTLTSKNWVIASVTVTPAMTSNNKTSNNYIELMGQASCVANLRLTFSNDGTYTSGSNGALCDMAASTDIKTWVRNDNQITLSANKNSPMTLNGNTLTQTITSPASGGTVYTFTYIYKAQSK